MKKAPIVSISLVVINILTYLICLFDGGRLYSLGCLDVSKVIVEGQYGRIVWAMFLHASTDHLFGNMIITLFLGSMIEKEIGHSWYILVYLFSGIGGNILSLCWKVIEHISAVSIGASGAVFGLDGMLIAMMLFLGKRLVQVTPIRVIAIILFSLYSGFATGNIDNAAHVGGLVTGFILGTIMCFVMRKKQLYKGGMV